MPQTSLLEVSGLARAYGRKQILRGVDMALEQGQVLGLLGLNGAGKTTTIELLAGAVAPDRGSISVCGHDLQRSISAARSLIGYAPQIPALFEDMCAEEFLAFRCRSHRLGGQSQAAVAKICARCGLDDVRARPIRHLSIGYRQRLNIAQALVHSPKLVLLDEPTGGLDPVQRRETCSLIKDLAQSAGVVLSTHILEDIREVATHVAVLHEGAIVYQAAQHRTENQLRVRLAAPVNRLTLERVMGVRHARAIDHGAWLVELDPAVMDVPRFASFLTSSGWGLQELTAAPEPLEAIFTDLARGRFSP